MTSELDRFGTCALSSGAAGQWPKRDQGDSDIPGGGLFRRRHPPRTARARRRTGLRDRPCSVRPDRRAQHATCAGDFRVQLGDLGYWRRGAGPAARTDLSGSGLDARLVVKGVPKLDGPLAALPLVVPLQQLARFPRGTTRPHPTPTSPRNEGHQTQ